MSGLLLGHVVVNRGLLTDFGHTSGDNLIHHGFITRKKSARIQKHFVKQLVAQSVSRQHGRRDGIVQAAEPRVSQKASFLEYISSYSSKLEVDAGEVTIRLLTEADIIGAAVCLTRGFSGTPEATTLQEAREYFEDTYEKSPKAVVLVATIIPSDKSLLPEGKTSRLIGTVTLSFSPSTREIFETLQPPDDSTYLQNMAVDKDFRRQGIARAMLSSCDDICSTEGQTEISLHVRLADPPSRELYVSDGYSEVDRDRFLSQLRGMRPRALLIKNL